MAISEATKEWLYRRSNQSAIPFWKLGLGVTFDSDGEPIGYPNGDVYHVAIFIDNLLSEDFMCAGMYEVNIADWLAEDLAEKYGNGEITSWHVIVSEYTFEGVGETYTRVGEIVYSLSEMGVQELMVNNGDRENLT